MRTVAGFPTCAATRRASTRNSESATGITTWTAPPPQTGESHRHHDQGELEGGVKDMDLLEWLTQCGAGKKTARHYISNAL